MRRAADGQRARLRPHRRGHVFSCAVSTERGSMWGTAPSRGASSSVAPSSTLGYHKAEAESLFGEIELQ